MRIIFHMLNVVFEVNGGLSYIAKLTLFIKLGLVSALVKKRSFSTLKTKVHLKEKGNFPMRHPVLKFQGWEPRIVGFVICTSLDIFILSSRANFLAERPVSETKNLCFKQKNYFCFVQVQNWNFLSQDAATRIRQQWISGLGFSKNFVIVVMPRYIAKMMSTTFLTIDFMDSAIHSLNIIRTLSGRLPNLQATVSNQHRNRNFISTTSKAL